MSGPVELSMDNWELHNGDALEVLKTLPSRSVDAMVTDPPAGISFMGKSWDGDKGGRAGWVAWLSSVMLEARRVMKPGSVGLVWALPRTSHWTACALEDAGFAIEDRVSHVFGTGFPKHKSKLKPSVEDWWLVRNPGGKKWLGVDACRVEVDGVELVERTGAESLCSTHEGYARSGRSAYTHKPKERGGPADASGRWPPHLMLSHAPECNGECVADCPIRIMGEQSGESSSPAYGGNATVRKIGTSTDIHGTRSTVAHGDKGTAARFFPQFHYFPKASRRDREEGLEGFERKTVRPPGNKAGDMTIFNDENGDPEWRASHPNNPAANHHPTVKASPLMRWLCRLACPPGGVILDPFMGSGSTGKAAMLEGFRFVGIEQDEAFVNIAEARVYAAEATA